MTKFNFTHRRYHNCELKTQISETQIVDPCLIVLIEALSLLVTWNASRLLMQLLNAGFHDLLTAKGTWY